MSRHLEGAPIPDEHRAEALAALGVDRPEAQGGTR